MTAALLAGGGVRFALHSGQGCMGVGGNVLFLAFGAAVIGAAVIGVVVIGAAVGA